MPYACIFVPDFPVEALLRAEPELRSQSLVVVEGKVPLQKVFAVNENARRAGVEQGMTKIQVEACADLVLRMRSLTQETAAHAALLDCAQSFSPRVEDTACDTILLDLTGMELLFGPYPTLARDMARRACDLGLQVNVAVASSPDAAALAARGFTGVTVIPEGKEAAQLGGLLVEILFAGQNPEESEPHLETLHRWGIRKLRELAALPDVDLSERLGQQGLYWQKLARGAVFRTLVPVEPPLIFEEFIELENPVCLLEPLAFLLSHMLEQLCARLESRALATQEIRLQLELQNGWHEDGIPWSDVGAETFGRRPQQHFQRILRLPVPLLDAKTFLKLLQLDLRAHPPGAPISKIHLSAEPARPRASQNGFFLPPSPEPEKLELTLARIAGIVGEDKVGSLQLLDTHRPEGFRMQRFAPSEPQQKSGSIKDSDNLVTALRIFRPPAAATVTMQDGRPTFLSCPHRKDIHGEILWAAGPWRSSGDWWEQDGWARDEWDIAVQGEIGIALYRLVRDLLRGRWLLEGTYD
jgi:protein ImuB